MHSFSKRKGRSNNPPTATALQKRNEKNVGRALPAFGANSVDMQIDWLWKCKVQTALRFSFFLRCVKEEGRSSNTKNGRRVFPSNTKDQI